MLTFADVSFSYEKGVQSVHVLEDVSFEVQRGTVLALIGPSGCGKSTLLLLAAGLLQPTAGDVLAEGLSIAPTQMRIGLLPQNYGLLAWKTVRENILLGVRIKGLWGKELAGRFEELVSDLGLLGLLERYPHELSGGQQQRVGLARVFLLTPDLLLMDEPFSALDAITRESMQAIFLSLWKKYAVTTLMVTHYVEEALFLAGRIAVMAGTPGRIVQMYDNPLAGDLTQRTAPAFFAMGQMLRRKITEEGT